MSLFTHHTVGVVMRRVHVTLSYVEGGRAAGGCVVAEACGRQRSRWTWSCRICGFSLDFGRDLGCEGLAYVVDVGPGLVVCGGYLVIWL